nr:adenine deaminase C-terminal domain-containing protein [uncultured Cohaesibacter sp.]
MTTERDLTDPALRGSAVAAAKGTQPFDILIRNATVLDMVTGRERLANIGLVGGLIASVHSPDANDKAEQEIDATGLYAIPGLIDTHMHIESSMITPAEYARTVLKRGVTTVVWDPHELANVAGLDGMKYALDAASKVPLRILTLAPTCVPSAPGYEIAGGDFDAGIIASLLARDDIHGAAELMTMQPLINGEPRVKGIVDAALASGKRVCGHARGLSQRDLAAFATAGIETDHELSSADDLMARLEAGMTVELRGSHEHLLPDFAKHLLALGHMPQTVTLCTDDVFPDDLLNKGALDHVIRILLGEGLPVWWVYQAATLNAATRIKRPDLGLIAPGKRADLLLVDDLGEVSSQYVICDGNVIKNPLDSAIHATESPYSAPTADAPSPAGHALSGTVKTHPFTAADFDVVAEGNMARIATLSKPRFPEWSERWVPIQNGVLTLPDDMMRMAIVNRHGQHTPVRVAFMEQWGTWRGAYASTVSHDSHNLTVFGRDCTDMAIAANALRAMDGGLVVVKDGEIIASLALPIAGLISEDSLDEVASGLAEIRAAMDAVVDWQPPYLVFKALFGASLVCNKGPRLSDVGIVDVFEERLLESCILETRHDL